ncbi:polyamine aminopropyltransferase [Streptomyces sp. NPDC059740]|uniref:polyamine aminopropyltransferase n=1 Tax=Streptomyces sp. NPDC059740 TaxID=3346926 RepID=UPI0036515AC6
MVDVSDPRVSDAAAAFEVAEQARLPVSAALGRLLVLLVVFVCAACGLVYELELVALASYLTGDTVTQASVVLSVMVFAMGVGSLLAKRLRCRAALGFGLVEAGLALVGGCSAMALFACFAWLGTSRPVLVGFSFATGVLVGAEVPLLMTLIQRIRRQDLSGAVADLFAADYVGALVGGLAFPFLLLPVLGQLTGVLLTGVVNALAGGSLVLWLFRRDLTRRARCGLLMVNLAALFVLLTALALAGPFERAARQAIYGAPRVAVRSAVQEVVVTGGDTGPDGRSASRAPGARPLALYLDGHLRVDGADEYRYHEALVHPAMSSGPHRRVLVLGGGDGLAVREILRYPDVASVTVVEIDPAVVRLARHDPGLARLNRGAMTDPRVRVVHSDAFGWLRRPSRTGSPPEGYDVVVSDLPDPLGTAGTKLYSQEFYGLVSRVLAPAGRLVVDAGSPHREAHAYWTVEATVRSAGLRTVPYAVARRSGPHSSPTGAPCRRGAGRDGSCWGYVLAGRSTPPLRLTRGGPHLRSLTTAVLRADAAALSRSRPTRLPPSTLLRPRYED